MAVCENKEQWFLTTHLRLFPPMKANLSTLKHNAIRPRLLGGFITAFFIELRSSRCRPTVLEGRSMQGRVPVASRIQAEMMAEFWQTGWLEVGFKNCNTYIEKVHALLNLVHLLPLKLRIIYVNPVVLRKLPTLPTL